MDIPQDRTDGTQVIRKFIFDTTAQCCGSKVAPASFCPSSFAISCSFQMSLPSARECLEEFDLDKDGKLSHAELGSCLEEVLSRGGCPNPKRTSALMVEEWALRSDGLAAGEGALDRLLRAAKGYCDTSEERSARKRTHSEAEE
eukprot:s450_g26.t1